jgi:4-hydroxy-tetrahydrodipicolinate synthase
MLTLKGSLVALVTPMTASGMIDYSALRGLVDWHIEAGTKALVILGTTGEAATINLKEREQIISEVVSRSNGRIPVVVGTGHHCTQQTIVLSRQAHQMGADAVLIVTPYYNKPTQEGLYQHFKLIADSVDCPQILYNVPGRTSVDLHFDTLQRLASHVNIVGLKDATADLERVPKLTTLGLLLFSGDDGTALEFCAKGGDGVISVAANVAPSQMQKIIAGSELDMAGASALNKSLNPLFKELFVETNPIPVKYMLQRMGKCCNTLRLPLTPLSAQFENKAEIAMLSAEIPLLNSIK